MATTTLLQVLKAPLGMRTNTIPVLKRRKTSPTGKHACFSLLDPKNLSEGAEKHDVLVLLVSVRPFGEAEERQKGVEMGKGKRVRTGTTGK